MEYNWDYLDKRAYNNQVGHYKFKKEFEFITRYGKDHFDNALDIAGGSGRFALPLAEREYCQDITLIDISNEALELAKQRNPSLKIQNGDFRQIDIDDSFTLILCMEALGYFDDWNLFFGKVKNVLATKGRFIFSYQNPQSWRYGLRKLKHWNKGTYNYHEMTLIRLKQLLYTLGFEIEQMEGMNWIPLPLSSNSQWVTFFAFIEKATHLNKWHQQSPWILFSVKLKD